MGVGYITFLKDYYSMYKTVSDNETKGNWHTHIQTFKQINPQQGFIIQMCGGWPRIPFPTEIWIFNYNYVSVLYNVIQSNILLLIIICLKCVSKLQGLCPPLLYGLSSHLSSVGNFPLPPEKILYEEVHTHVHKQTYADGKVSQCTHILKYYSTMELTNNIDSLQELDNAQVSINDVVLDVMKLIGNIQYSSDSS